MAQVSVRSAWVCLFRISEKRRPSLTRMFAIGFCNPCNPCKQGQKWEKLEGSIALSFFVGGCCHTGRPLTLSSNLSLTFMSIFGQSLFALAHALGYLTLSPCPSLRTPALLYCYAWCPHFLSLFVCHPLCWFSLYSFACGLPAVPHAGHLEPRTRRNPGKGTTNVTGTGTGTGTESGTGQLAILTLIEIY